MNDKPADPLQLSYAAPPPRRWTPARIGFLCGATLQVAINLYCAVAFAAGSLFDSPTLWFLIVANLPATPCILGWWKLGFQMGDEADGLAVVGSFVVGTGISAPLWGLAGRFVGQFIGWLVEGTSWERPGDPKADASRSRVSSRR